MPYFAMELLEGPGLHDWDGREGTGHTRRVGLARPADSERPRGAPRRRDPPPGSQALQRVHRGGGTGGGPRLRPRPGRSPHPAHPQPRARRHGTLPSPREPARGEPDSRLGSLSLGGARVGAPGGPVPLGRTLRSGGAPRQGGVRCESPPLRSDDPSADRRRGGALPRTRSRRPASPTWPPFATPCSGHRRPSTSIPDASARTPPPSISRRFTPLPPRPSRARACPPAGRCPSPRNRPRRPSGAASSSSTKAAALRCERVVVPPGHGLLRHAHPKPEKAHHGGPGRRLRGHRPPPRRPAPLGAPRGGAPLRRTARGAPRPSGEPTHGALLASSLRRATDRCGPGQDGRRGEGAPRPPWPRQGETLSPRGADGSLRPHGSLPSKRLLSTSSRDCACAGGSTSWSAPSASPLLFPAPSPRSITIRRLPWSIRRSLPTSEAPRILLPGMPRRKGLPRRTASTCSPKARRCRAGKESCRRPPACAASTTSNPSVTWSSTRARSFSPTRSWAAIGPAGSRRWLSTPWAT